MIPILRFVSSLVQISQVSSYFSKGNMFCLTSRFWWGRQRILFSFTEYNCTIFFLFQKQDWPMHKLECSAMCAFGQNWNPSETVRLTARILAKQVSKAQGFRKSAGFCFERWIGKGQERHQQLFLKKSFYVHLFMSYWQLLWELITDATFLLHTLQCHWTASLSPCSPLKSSIEMYFF